MDDFLQCAPKLKVLTNNPNDSCQAKKCFLPLVFSGCVVFYPFSVRKSHDFRKKNPVFLFKDIKKDYILNIKKD
jgi:hypothetical protein